MDTDLAVATAWAPLAVATLIELWDKKSEPSSGAFHTQLLSIIAGSIKCLQVCTHSSDTTHGDNASCVSCNQNCTRGPGERHSVIAHRTITLNVHIFALIALHTGG
jgi:hypothetical protein